MIVVGILVPERRPGAAASASTPAGMVSETARRSAAAGTRTEVVGVVSAGPGGDRQLIGLAEAGIGHATVVRSSAAEIEPADLELALRYLPDVRVIVLVAPSASMLATATAAASWSDASLIIVGPIDAAAAAELATAEAAPAMPVLLDPPARDPDGAFAGVVAALAVRLDAGDDPASAWRSTVATLAIDPASHA
jgi:hypothetical protein